MMHPAKIQSTENVCVLSFVFINVSTKSLTFFRSGSFKHCLWLGLGNVLKLVFDTMKYDNLKTKKRNKLNEEERMFCDRYVKPKSRSMNKSRAYFPETHPFVSALCEPLFFLTLWRRHIPYNNSIYFSFVPIHLLLFQFWLDRCYSVYFIVM